MTRSATESQPRGGAVPRHLDDGVASGPRSTSAGGAAPDARPRGPRRWRARPSPRRWRSRSTAGRSPASRAAVATARAIGCSEASSTAPASRSTSPSSSPSAATTSSSVISPVVTVPVLSSTTVSTRRVDSSTSGPLMRMPSWAPRPVPTMSAVGVARPRAHGQAMISTATAAVNAASGAGAGAEPEAERADGERDHHGHEHPGDPVGEALHLRLAVLGVLDQPRHLRELGVGADPRGADDEPAARVHGGADHGVADADLDRHGLTGEHGGVDRGGTLDDDAVGGDLLAGPDDEQVAHGQLVDRDPRLDTVPRAPRRPWRPSRAAPAAPPRPAAWNGPRRSGRPG